MEVKTWNRVSSMQLRGLYEVMVGKALGKKKHTTARSKESSRRRKNEI
jgi:hypothetical protein